MIAAVLAAQGRRSRRGVDLVGATKQLIEDIALYDDLRDASGSMSAAQRRIDNVTGLLGSLQRFTDKGEGSDRLAEYLRALSLERATTRSARTATRSC